MTAREDGAKMATRTAKMVITSAIESLAIHGEACGHRKFDDECGYCDDRRTADQARGAARVLFDALATVESERDLARSRATRSFTPRQISQVITHLHYYLPNHVIDALTEYVNGVKK